MIMLSPSILCNGASYICIWHKKALMLIYEMFTMEGKRNCSSWEPMRLFASLKTQKKKEEN